MVFQGKGIFIFRVFFVLLIYVLFHCKCNNGADQPLYVKQKRFCVAADTDNTVRAHTPYFCQLAFDFGTCFGQYNRWTWDHIAGHCRRRLYSGCGGNQNNFETKEECMANCMSKPNNTLNAAHSQLTTCIPFSIAEFN
ncbi:hypothetical protein HF086_006913 [Spodoptera exigua]|uniref:BPTI/Kunitz inhibitor domain-containing protein n=1 Tax=Spodoptera exigua TaxID=7107 RepID=A0A922MIV3_SPOEX|nr:hypothetical protein HF086_006913 [Spodoptera exigua]